MELLNKSRLPMFIILKEIKTYSKAECGGTQSQEAEAGRSL